MKNLIKASTAVAFAVLVTGCNFEQPTPPCAVGHGGYAAELVKLTGPETGNCVRRADIIGVQKYRQTSGNPVIALKPEVISTEFWGAGGATGDEYTSVATGTLSANLPDAEGFCTAPTMTAAVGNAIAGYELTYTFSNVQFFVRGSVAGTQFTADLEIDDGLGCVATYEVRAMYPVIFCNTETEDGSDLLNTQDPSHCEPGFTDHVWSGYAANPAFASKCSAYGNPGETGSDYDYYWSGSLD